MLWSLHFFPNPFNSLSDQEIISPYNTNTISSRPVMRITKKYQQVDDFCRSNIKFSELTLQKLYSRQWGELLMRIRKWRGLVNMIGIYSRCYCVDLFHRQLKDRGKISICRWYQLYHPKYLHCFLDFVVIVNNHNLKVNIILDKNGTPCQTGVLEVILDGMSVNMRHFPRRVPTQTPTPVANGPATAPRTGSQNSTTPSRQSHP